MKTFKNAFIGMTTAAVLAGTMICSAAFAEEAPAEPAETAAEVTADAAVDAVAEATVEQADPIQGSWVLYEVREIKEGADPVLLPKEENQSLYGSGIGVYTFDEDGYAHHNMIDAGDNKDEEASWAAAEPSVYSYTEGSESMSLRYDDETDTLHRTYDDGTRTLDFVYARAMVGSWKLDNVVEIHEGDAPTDLPKEENQSLYGSGESILTFSLGGKASDEITDGPDKVVMEGSWELTAPDQFTYTEDTLEMEFCYFRADDTIFRDFVDDAPDAAHPHLRFTYVRVTPEPKAAEQETTKAAEKETTKAAQNETKPATQPTTKPAEKSTEEGLINDGKIFTGYEMDNLIDVATGSYVTLSELSQGGWANQATGEIFEQEGGGGPHMYGDKGTVLMFDGEYYAEYGTEEELINDGKIFTGNYMSLYDEYGNVITLSELSQGGWADEDTGEIFNRGPAGGDFWYGDHGTTLSAEYDGGYAGSNYDEEEDYSWADDDEGYAGSNYDEDEMGGYAGSNYYENEEE